ncbi:LGFP repeat-containing protein, partial [Agromyces sp. NPDC058064]|uniref:LGFP repeat-containing protein n=1 Tax=Agromyces sp. NPDC058064 TaxID=3346322 RepID=UPI0036DC7338
MLAVLMAFVLTIGLATADGIVNEKPAVAADGAEFNPGMIISDAVFYNSATMTVAQIQSFLNAKVPTCRTGYVCLKNFRQTTTSQPARSEGCAAYAGQANESAALIIYKVSRACGINPQSMLVLLEKEQGLVSDTWPTSRQYRSATGYGCPDTADCDVNYYGFFNQVYHAAWQFKKYRARPTIRAYQAGRYNTIQWHPNAGCGTSQVYIQNQATAGLYLYTPYRPNAAALRNLYGTGDACSSYGNRNFWRMFTDWFGSTAVQVHPALMSAWLQHGGADGRLGPPIAAAQSVSGGGILQRFERGQLVYRADLGAFRTAASIATYYYANGGPAGRLGYPVSDVAGADAIEHTQSFEFGFVSWKPESGIAVRGGYRVSEPYLANWKALKQSQGVLGYPIAGVVDEGSGWSSQRFERGYLLYDGARKVMYWLPSAVWDFWKARGGLGGAIGAPTASPTGSADSGWTQTFVGARLTQASTGTVTMVGGIAVAGVFRTNWSALRGGSGVLGYPIAGVVDEGSGWSSQRFERGYLLYDGARKVMYWLP